MIQLIATSGFEVFVTVDQSLQYQQHFGAVSFAVVILCPVRNRLIDMLPLMTLLVSALATIKAGDVVEISP